MAREVDVSSYLPPVLQEVKELVEIANIENPVLETLWQEIENTLNNQFVITANENGAKRYEKMLKMSVPGTDALETRRFHILTRYQEQIPYYFKVLSQLLDSLLGEGRYLLNRDVANKTLTVKIELTVKGMFDAVIVMLERITPQNMVLVVDLRYNTWGKIKQLTWGDLKTRTWRQIKEEVI